jgi:hypothetical protein
LVGLGRRISAFKASESCESIEEVISDILKLEIRSIYGVKVSLATRMPVKVTKNIQKARIFLGTKVYTHSDDSAFGSV